MLFAPGPVEMDEAVCQIAACRSLPYFRGQQFAETVRNVSAEVAYLFQTQNLPLPITASGTGLMEMAVTNLLDPGDRVIVLNGGTFGQRWTDICAAFQVSVLELKPGFGRSPDLDVLDGMLTPDVKAVLVNMHETSTGYLYDIEAIGKVVRSHGALFIVDAVSAIGADPFLMDEWQVDCALVSTQKALALMPGLGYIAFSPLAWERMEQVKRGRYYFNALDCRQNLTRGMTPFTPAMISILQVQQRMKGIRATGLNAWIGRHADRAGAFRKALFDGSGEFSLYPQRSSNAMSAVALPPDITADSIVAYMRDNYDWWFAPNPTKIATYFRVSHMGDLSGDLLKFAAIRIIETVEQIRKRGRA